MDSKAVSALIGFVLMLAIIMGFIGIMQSKFVPEWNKDVEAKHLDKLSYEVADLSEAVSLAASTGNPAKVVLDAGVEYPEYYVLVSPSKSSGTIRVKPLNVSIGGIGNFRTHAIIFRPNYFYLSPPLLVFEHSAVLRIHNSSVVVDSDQSSFTRDRITLFLVNATFNEFSTTENINIVLYPVSYGGHTLYSGTLSFECYDEETASWWNETLSKIFGQSNVSKNGNSITLQVNNIELSVNYFVASATSAGEVEYDQELSPAHLKPLLNNQTTYQLSSGQTKEFGVAVLDKFMNPVRGPGKLNSVTVSSDCGSCNVYTNPNGEVWCDFVAGNGECTGDVTFTLGSFSVKYHVHVKQPVAAGGGIFDVSWNVSSYDWNVSQVGYEKRFKVTVSYNSNPVSNINVDIATDNASVVSVPSEITTNSEGEGVVDVWAMSNGTANVFAAVGGSVGILELAITGVGACHGWGYWREITITNSGNDLTDYQIKIELDSSNFNFGHAKSDGSDIRFYDSDRVTPLSYWIEEWDSSGEHAVIWVKVPSIPSGSKKIYMYYGNPTATSESDVSRVFIPGKIAMFAYDWRNDLYGPYADNHYEFQGAINSDLQKLHSEYVEKLNWLHSGDSDSGAFGYFSFRSYDFMALFRFLLIPGEKGITEIATDSDDASEIIVDDTVTANWYGGHAPCCRGSCCLDNPPCREYCWEWHKDRVNINGPVWIEYRMQEWYGTEAARMAVKFSGDSSWYVIDANNLPYNTKIFARKYAEIEPSVSLGAEHAC